MTIKETAGKILLYFYQLQRTVPSSMQHRQIGFVDRKNGSVAMTTDKKWLTKDLQDINPSSSDIFNAFTFLFSKGFIQSRERATTGTRIFIGPHVTHLGIDVVEGIEGDQEDRRRFSSTFNIQVSEDADIDRVIKNNLSKLVE